MSKLTTEQLFRRLRLNPVICMDGVNITDLAIAAEFDIKINPEDSGTHMKFILIP